MATRARKCPARSTADIIIEVARPSDASTADPRLRGILGRKAELLLEMQGWYGYTRDEDDKRVLMVLA